MALSKPLLYGGLVAIGAAAIWASASEPEKVGKASSKKAAASKKASAADWRFPEEELAARFEKPSGPLRNVFKPLVEAERTSAQMPSDELEQMKFPSAYADGDSGWVYTGMVEVDGKKLALLENLSTHQGGYLSEGETWKKARVLRITMASILVAGLDGSEQTVFRYNANATPKPKPMPESGFRPMDVSPAMRGPIGMELKRSEPLPGASAPGSTPGPSKELAPPGSSMEIKK